MLPRTPAPRTTESLWGYALRVSETNGYDTPWHILAYAGFSQREMKTAGFPVDKLAAVLGREPSALAGIAYCGDVADERHFKILEHRLGTGMSQGWLRLAEPAFCPKCAEEDGYLDAFWDLSQAVACPTHGCRLINSCPACGKKLRWYRPGLLTCKCDANLAEAASVPADGLLVQLMAVMKAKLHGVSVVALPNSTGLPLAAIDQMPFRAFLGMTNGLGTFGLVTHGKNTEQDTYRVMEQAAHALADWPSGYHAYLRRLGAILKQERPKAIGLRKQFERFYQCMFKDRVFASEMAFLREEFVNFGQSEWGEAIVDRKLLRDHMVPDSRFQSVAQTAREAGVRGITLKSWADKGLVPIKTVNTEGGLRRYVVDKNAAPISQRTPGHIFETRRAAAYANLPVSVLLGLKESGHYVTDNWPRHKTGFHEADLDALRERILQRAISILSVPEDTPAVSLHYVLQEVRFWSKSGKAAFVAAYLDGAVDSIGRTGESFGETYFQKADVDAHASFSRKAASFT